MVESLIRLESQVGKLIHHAMKDGESMLHNHHPNGHVEKNGSKHEASKPPPDASQEPEPSESLLDAAYRLRYDEVPHSGRRQRPRELPETSLDKLALRVEHLMEQVAHLMKKSQDRFEKVGENLVPPPKEETGELAHGSKNGGWNDGREYYQGGR